MSLTTALRALRLLVSLAILGVIYLQATDPYAIRLLIADVGPSAPSWVRIVQGGDLILLLVILGAAVRRATWTHRVMIGELLYVVLANVLFVKVSGLDRFTVGFASQEYASTFLTQVALRVGALAALLSIGAVREASESQVMENRSVTEHLKPATAEHFKTGHRGERGG